MNKNINQSTSNILNAMKSTLNMFDMPITIYNEYYSLDNNIIITITSQTKSFLNCYYNHSCNVAVQSVQGNAIIIDNKVLKIMKQQPVQSYNIILKILQKKLTDSNHISE
jgi:hypothetical protein